MYQQQRSAPYWLILCQNCVHRPAVWVNARRLSTILAPAPFQRIPEAQSRCLMRVLHAASVTPEPIGSPAATKLE